MGLFEKKKKNIAETRKSPDASTSELTSSGELSICDEKGKDVFSLLFGRFFDSVLLVIRTTMGQRKIRERVKIT